MLPYAHFKDGGVEAGSRTIHRSQNLELRGHDVDPGALPLVWELSHLWLQDREMDHQLVESTWSI